MAATAPNMGLKVWNLLTDPYDHSQLASNWAKVDQHDHSSGKGIQIPTGGIADGAISTAKIGEDQVTDTKILNAPVRGLITGSTATINQGTGFTVTRSSAGVYVITLTPVLPSVPDVTATCVVGGTGQVALVSETTTSVVKINTYSVSTTLAASDAIFHFIAIPS